MDQRSVFFDEWLQSLREQYKHVVRSDDRVTLPTLTAVMQKVGFREEELRQLRLESTMRVDDVADDFVPDLEILRDSKTLHPSECLCPTCQNIDESQFDAEGQPIAPDPEAKGHETGHIFAAAEVEGQDDEVENEPVTFEDSLAADDVLLKDDTEFAEDADEAGADDDDPDAPRQISLF